MIQAIDQLFGAYERGQVSRREALAGLGALVATLAATGRVASAAETPSSTFTATGLNHIALRVTDVGRSRDFYAKHLGLEVLSQGGSNCFMSCGPDNFVALFRGTEAGMDHYCYTVKGYDVDQSVKTLEAAGLDPRRRQNRVYFSDPDGLTVQLSGKRDSRPSANG